jgi:cytidine deaminase
MEIKTKQINYFEALISELNEEDKNALQNAQKAIENSYSPYSKFRVASAVTLDNKEVFLGANQENSAYPSGLCAERVALFYASANSKGAKLISIAVVANNSKGEFALAYPCGACLQVMKEMEIKYKNSLRIIVQIDAKRVQIFEGVEALMPFSFIL